MGGSAVQRVVDWLPGGAAVAARLGWGTGVPSSSATSVPVTRTPEATGSPTDDIPAGNTPTYAVPDPTITVAHADRPLIQRIALPSPTSVDTRASLALPVVTADPAPPAAFLRRMGGGDGVRAVQRWEAPGGNHPGFTEVRVQRDAGGGLDRLNQPDELGRQDVLADEAPDVQRAEETPPAEAPEAALPQAPAQATAPPPQTAAQAPAQAAPSPGAPGQNLDDLARRLYEPLAARLRAELWLDRERSGRSLVR
jgi:hypothetical protein